MNHIKYGYHGIEGSYSEKAARKFAGNDLHELIPLVTIKAVKNALLEKSIDYGVIATHNSIGGPVLEMRSAFDGSSFEYPMNELNESDFAIISQVGVSIEHYLFKKSDDILNTDIKSISSHSQALLQTTNTIDAMFSEIERVAIEDTAIGAKRLANGELNDSVAIVCSKEAGHLHGLSLIQANVEDRSDNMTTFWLVELGRN